jgi:LacI family transcriptional regulator
LVATFRLRDVAALAEVSTATVSRVMRGIHVDPVLEARVRDAADRLGYQPNALAQALRGGRSGVIGLIVPDVSNPWFADLARVLEDGCQERGLSLVLCNSNNRLDREDSCLELLWNRRVDGVLLLSVSGRAPQSLIERQHKSWPVVAFDRSYAAPNIDVVMADNYAGMSALLDHLVAAGYRRFGHISTDDSLSAAAERRSAVVDGLVRHELPLLAEREGDFTYESGYAAAKALLSSAPSIDVIVAENDLMAIGALQYCTAEGMKVPGDIAIAGFDDMALSSWVSPSLTTVRQDRSGLAEQALSLLQSRLDSPDLAARSITVPCELKVRGSTASKN